MKPYTYLVKHKPTGHVYYGVRTANKVSPSEDLWQEYFTSSKKVHALIEESGQDSFDIQIRREFDSVEEAIKWETKVLRRCRVLENNIWLNANIAGHIPATEEVRAKISAFHKGKTKSEEHRKKISQANKGKVQLPLSEQQKETLSKMMSGTGNPMYGRKHSNESLAKMRLALKGRVAHNKGKPMSEEQKRKQSEIMSGRKQNPLHVQKKAESLKALNLKRERKICPHCNKDIAINIYARYHGDRCKFKS